MFSLRWRIATPGCSDRTIRRRVNYWAQIGTAEKIHALALQAYDRMIGLQLDELSVDGCITRAPGGEESAGRSPVDRGKQGLKRSVATEATGVPLGIVSAGANRHDSPLLVPTLKVAKEQVGELPDRVNVNLDRGYDSDKTRSALGESGFTGEIARKGIPAPIQAGKRWVVERSHAWMNGFGKLRRCTEQRSRVVASISTCPQRSSCCVCSSAARPRATAGTAAPPPDASSDPFAGRSQPQSCSCWSRSASPSIRSEPAGMRMYMSRAISLAVP
ncbi:hypothetical protein GCM10027187_47720 [Streptosporangium sandarakinum]|uniref:Transposase IS4-like domain-containing protein n=1 Tax=Streptosporangium sandarakinum TaxID=1260955 RepID=A0A852UPE9_9ACTN|nr:hypothetical protein [Streptosporangium sandarakinum]